MNEPLEYGRPWWEVMKEVTAENARLKAENENAWGSARTYSRLWIEAKENKERLEAEVERLRESSFVTAVPVEEYEKLKADLERLRKAGDAMASALILFEMKTEEERADRIKAWSAAKEGKQP